MGRRFQQTTIARSFAKTGIGLHTGLPCSVSLRPLGPDAGIVFAVESGTEIPATAEYVVDTRRGTTLGVGGATVGCVEHLLAALYAMGIDNARVEVTGAEVPACDGSALEWVELLRQCGSVRLDADRHVARLERIVWAGEGASSALALPGGSALDLAVAVGYEGTVASDQSLRMRLTAPGFAREIAPARTFALLREIEELRAGGLSRGGSEANAFAVGPRGYSGVLRFEDEVVRHKTLDLVGDLALCGRRFGGVVVAVRPSHRVNVQLARALRRHVAANACCFSS